MKTKKNSPIRNTLWLSIAAILNLGIAPLATAADSAAPVQRGQHLVMSIGCNDCHTPFKMGAHGPEPDMSRMLSGHPEAVKLPPPPALNNDWNWAGSATGTAFTGPWGTSYAFNLTPDAETGLGNWTEKMFVDAIKTGKHYDGSRPIMPPMPWQAFSNLSEDDLKAIYAYLRTIPSIRNKVPDYQPPAAKIVTGNAK